jgi:hypothetical protein
VTSDVAYEQQRQELLLAFERKDRETEGLVKKAGWILDLKRKQLAQQIYEKALSVKDRNDAMGLEYGKRLQEMEEGYMLKKMEMQKYKIKVWKEKAVGRMEGDSEWAGRRKHRQHKFAKRQQRIKKFKEIYNGTEDDDESVVSSPAKRTRAEKMLAISKSPKKKPKKRINQKSEVSRTIFEDRNENGDLLDLAPDKTMSDFLIGEDQIEINLYCVKNLPSNVTVSKMIFEIITSENTVLYGPKEFLPDLTSSYLSPSYQVSFLLDSEKILATSGLLMRITLITIDDTSIIKLQNFKNFHPPQSWQKKVGYFLKPLFKTTHTNKFSLKDNQNSYPHEGSFKLPLYIDENLSIINGTGKIDWDLQYKCEKYFGCELFLTVKRSKSK